MEERDKGVQIRDHPSNNYCMGAPPLQLINSATDVCVLPHVPEIACIYLADSLLLAASSLHAEHVLHLCGQTIAPLHSLIPHSLPLTPSLHLAPRLPVRLLLCHSPSPTLCVCVCVCVCVCKDSDVTTFVLGLQLMYIHSMYVAFEVLRCMRICVDLVVRLIVCVVFVWLSAMLCNCCRTRYMYMCNVHVCIHLEYAVSVYILLGHCVRSEEC